MIMDDDSTENTPASALNRRRVLAGTAGLGAAALLGAKLVQAQTATGTPEGRHDRNGRADLLRQFRRQAGGESQHQRRGDGRHGDSRFADGDC